MTGVRKTSSLTKETEKMLETAVDLLGAGKEREEEADAVSQASQASYAVSKFTWYKLVEWIQVKASKFFFDVKAGLSMARLHD